jgi:hypothetical protein
MGGWEAIVKLRCECARDYCHGSLLHKQTNKQIYITNKQTNKFTLQTNNRVSIANKQNQQDSSPPIITKMGSNVHY